MTFIQTMLKEGYTTRTPVKQAFETEKYSMKFSGVWTVTDMETNFQKVDYGVMPYPVSPKTKKLVSPSGSWQFAMTQRSEKKEWSDQMNVFMKQLKESGHARPVTPAYPQVTRAFQQTIDDISFYDQNKNI